MKKRAIIKVNGIVQGVWYRASTQKMAQKLNLTGWVKNNPDGSVSILAEGEENNLNELINWCWEGPPAAKVENVKVSWDEYTGEYSSFDIIY